VGREKQEKPTYDELLAAIRATRAVLASWPCAADGCEHSQKPPENEDERKDFNPRLCARCRLLKELRGLIEREESQTVAQRWPKYTARMEEEEHARATNP
jgi:hypothetical protein